MSEQMGTVTIRLPKRIIDYYKNSNAGHTTAMREVLWREYALRTDDELMPEDEMRKAFMLSRLNFIDFLNPDQNSQGS